MRGAVIGGGHGASATLRAVRSVCGQIDAVITIADDGGSSGRLSAQMGVLPMGDIRECLVALSTQHEVANAFQHRFSSGPLKGHVVGNIFMAGIAESRPFPEAIAALGALLGCVGRVHPPTLERVTLSCEVAGKKIQGQVSVATARGPITALSIEPASPPAFRPAVEAIRSADVLVLGPGSLFTSVIPPLLVPEIREAFASSNALKIYVCNLGSPMGETEEFDAQAHVDALVGYMGTTLDVIVVHQGRPLVAEIPPVTVDRRHLEGRGMLVVARDLLPDDGSPRHDPQRLADALAVAVGRVGTVPIE